MKQEFKLPRMLKCDRHSINGFKNPSMSDFYFITYATIFLLRKGRTAAQLPF